MKQTITDELLEDLNKLQALVGNIKQKLNAQEDIELDYLIGYREGFKDGFLDSRQDLHMLKRALEEIRGNDTITNTNEEIVESYARAVHIAMKVLAKFEEGESNQI